ncbi:MAG: lipopolysaccharide biosynthesis protein [Streptosporangiaceae bacterium]
MARSRLLVLVHRIADDPLYRGSLVMLTNTAALSALGFVFWALAARSYPAATVGSFSGLTSGINLFAAVAALGLPNVITRHLSGAPNPLGLMAMALAAITALGGTLCAISVLVLGPHLPAALHLQQDDRIVFLFTVLVIGTALSGAIGAGLVAVRATQAVLWTNLAGALARLVAVCLLTSMRSSGLVIAFSLGLTLATLLSALSLAARVPGGDRRVAPFQPLQGHLTAAGRVYIGTILGILPSTVVPLEVLAARGPAQTAPFAISFLVAGFLNVIPSTTSQVLFAEASRRGTHLSRQLPKALRTSYGLLIPALVIVVAGAPVIMRIFGASYAARATDCLRVLALSAILTSASYLVDSLLIARDRTGAYLFMNGANAALVLGLVYALVPRGLAGAAAGWALAQAASLLLGLIVLATGGIGRHRRNGTMPPAATAERASPDSYHGQFRAGRTTAQGAR